MKLKQQSMLKSSSRVILLLWLLITVTILPLKPVLSKKTIESRQQGHNVMHAPAATNLENVYTPGISKTEEESLKVVQGISPTNPDTTAAQRARNSFPYIQFRNDLSIGGAIEQSGLHAMQATLVANMVEVNQGASPYTLCKKSFVSEMRHIISAVDQRAFFFQLYAGIVQLLMNIEPTEYDQNFLLLQQRIAKAELPNGDSLLEVISKNLVLLSFTQKKMMHHENTFFRKANYQSYQGALDSLSSCIDAVHTVMRDVLQLKWVGQNVTSLGASENVFLSSTTVTITDSIHDYLERYLAKSVDEKALESRGEYHVEVQSTGKKFVNFMTKFSTRGASGVNSAANVVRSTEKGGNFENALKSDVVTSAVNIGTHEASALETAQTVAAGAELTAGLTAEMSGIYAAAASILALNPEIAGIAAAAIVIIAGLDTVATFNIERSLGSHRYSMRLVDTIESTLFPSELIPENNQLCFNKDPSMNLILLLDTLLVVAKADDKLMTGCTEIAASINTLKAQKKLIIPNLYSTRTTPGKLSITAKDKPEVQRAKNVINEKLFTPITDLMSLQLSDSVQSATPIYPLELLLVGFYEELPGKPKIELTPHEERFNTKSDLFLQYFKGEITTNANGNDELPNPVVRQVSCRKKDWYRPHPESSKERLDALEFSDYDEMCPVTLRLTYHKSNADQKFQFDEDIRDLIIEHDTRDGFMNRGLVRKEDIESIRFEQEPVGYSVNKFKEMFDQKAPYALPRIKTSSVYIRLTLKPNSKIVIPQSSTSAYLGNPYHVNKFTGLRKIKYLATAMGKSVKRELREKRTGFAYENSKVLIFKIKASVNDSPSSSDLNQQWKYAKFFFQTFGDTEKECLDIGEAFDNHVCKPHECVDDTNCETYPINQKCDNKKCVAMECTLADESTNCSIGPKTLCAPFKSATRGVNYRCSVPPRCESEEDCDAFLGSFSSIQNLDPEHKYTCNLDTKRCESTASCERNPCTGNKICNNISKKCE